MSRRTLRQVINYPAGWNEHRHHSTAGATIREIANIRPEIILYRTDKGCVEVTLPLLFDLFAESGRLRKTSSHIVTVPRRGWVVLIPRPAGKEAAR